ncbi:hypothetical protein C8J57DRAFT_694745 [Mycena rebaudengoi]|nr:hypothetical protein C8J57DRAFT_694745 [Mycena rebaudengoi]
MRKLTIYHLSVLTLGKSTMASTTCTQTTEYPRLIVCASNLFTTGTLNASNDCPQPETTGKNIGRQLMHSHTSTASKNYTSLPASVFSRIEFTSNT